MSIIEEALRRVQDPLGKSPGVPAPAASPRPSAATPQQPQTPEPAPRAHSWQPDAPAPAAGSQNGPLLAVVGAVLVLTAVLVMGGAFWMGRMLHTTSGAGAPPAAIAAAPNAVAEPPAQAAPEAVIRSPRPRPAPKAATEDPTSLVLSGIVEGLGEPYAVINGLIVAAGERVGNTTLEKIENGSVLLRRDDSREIVLRVPR